MRNKDWIYIQYAALPVQKLRAWSDNMAHWMWWLVFAIAPCTGHLYMIIEYDTEGMARPTLFNFTLHTVELQVTLLGCDHGYYVSNIQPLECSVCVCTDFVDGHSESFVESTA